MANTTLTDHKKELKLRVDARKKELESALAKARADVAGSQNEQAAQMEKKLSELSSMLKEGWDNLSDTTAKKLNDWLK